MPQELSGIIRERVMLMMLETWLERRLYVGEGSKVTTPEKQ